MQSAFLQNRISGLSFALLCSKVACYSEKTLYTNLLNLHKYQTKGLRIIDYEDTDLVVEKQFDDFADIYRPLLQSERPFSTYVELMDSKFLPSQKVIVQVSIGFQSLRTKAKKRSGNCS